MIRMKKSTYLSSGNVCVNSFLNFETFSSACVYKSCHEKNFFCMDFSFTIFLILLHLFGVGNESGLL